MCVCAATVGDLWCGSNMESGAQPGRRSDSLRKRTLEERKNTGGDCVLLPAKHRESDEETEELVTNRAR